MQHPAFWSLILAMPLLMVMATALRVSYSMYSIISATPCSPAVGQHAVRGLANRAFVHLHNLSLRFHLQRRTGGLSRVIERGKAGIETIIRLTMMVGIPTIVEFVLTAVIIAFQFSRIYVVVVAADGVRLCLVLDHRLQWRISIRKDMNEADSDADVEGGRFPAQLRNGQIFRQ